MQFFPHFMPGWYQMEFISATVENGIISAELEYLDKAREPHILDVEFDINTDEGYAIVSDLCCAMELEGITDINQIIGEEFTGHLRVYLNGVIKLVDANPY